MVDTKAQFGFEFKDSILVKKGSDTLRMAFSGGLSYAQFSDIDYDFDGDMDLFIFDRSSDNIRVFIQEEEKGQHFYRLEYNARMKFPSDLRYRATTVDYDNDGKKDLFTYGVGGIKVYRNVGNAINGLQWTLVSKLLYTDNWGTRLNLYVSSADIPAFVDVEGDSDIDVLTFHIGGQHVEYHQNQSFELYGIPDSLIFELKNECWGGFREDLNTSTIYLNDNTLECTTENVPGAKSQLIVQEEKKFGNGMPKHAGSTLLALDFDNSGVLDLVLGDVTFPNLTLLLNGGNKPNMNSRMVSQDNYFPSNSIPANLQIFPAAFWVDVDFDLKKDLIVCPNARTSPENEKSILFYKNVGTNQLPTFVYQTNEFFQNEMIEHGTGSQPLLFDYDRDGLKDLFVANFFRYVPTLNKESYIAYYKNTGTANNPVFTFIDHNFLNLNVSELGLKLTPTFGDIDGDNDEDLYIGRDNGTLSFFENKGSPEGVNFSGPINNVTTKNGTVISVGQAAHPQLFDLNNDGLLDLVIGRKNGEIAYYQNVGTPFSPAFELFNDKLGNITVSTNTGIGYAAPHFFRINNITYLFLGASDGQLHYYKGIEGQLNPTDTFDFVSDNYLNIDAGAYSSFWVEDLDNDGNLNLLVGQDLGGLFHFEANPLSNASLEELNILPKWMIYPNPAFERVNIEWDPDLNVCSVSLQNFQGLMIQQFSDITSCKLNVPTDQLAQGVYFVELETENGRFTRKFMKQ
jgi:hypothetical protein